MTVEDAPLVRYDVADQIATIAFDRPKKLNAITFAMRDLLLELLDKAEADPDVRVVIVKGNGRAFTSGVDLKDRPDLQDPSGRSIEADEAEIETAARGWERMLRFPKPILVKAQRIRAERTADSLQLVGR